MRSWSSVPWVGQITTLVTESPSTSKFSLLTESQVRSLASPYVANLQIVAKMPNQDHLAKIGWRNESCGQSRGISIYYRFLLETIKISIYRLVFAVAGTQIGRMQVPGWEQVAESWSLTILLQTGGFLTATPHFQCQNNKKHTCSANNYKVFFSFENFLKKCLWFVITHLPEGCPTLPNLQFF